MNRKSSWMLCVVFLAFSGAGCQDRAEVERARAEAEKSRAEAERSRAEVTKLQIELERAKNESRKIAADERLKAKVEKRDDPPQVMPDVVKPEVVKPAPGPAKRAMDEVKITYNRNGNGWAKNTNTERRITITVKIELAGIKFDEVHHLGPGESKFVSLGECVLVGAAYD
jgi:hypothetical protein